MKVAIVGCGMLGYDLVRTFLDKKDVELFCYDNKITGDILGKKIYNLDITNANQTYETLTKLNPDTIILTSSITDVDFCEENSDLAYRVNTIGVKNVAIAAQKFDSLLVYLSTDYVFDGKKGKEYTEFDLCCPLNVYGETKLQGENFVRQILNRYLIIRTSWMFGKNRKNYISYWYTCVSKGQKPIIVDGQVGSPTYSKDLAQNICYLIKENKIGLYNVTNLEGTDRLTVFKEMCKIIGVEFNIKNICLKPANDVFKKAVRPMDTRLDNFIWKLEDLPKIRSWKDAIRDYIFYDLK